MYKFKSKAAADVLMLTPHGDRLLGLMGREPSRQGILEVADMPAALAALAAAIDADEAAAGASDEANGAVRGEKAGAGSATGADAVRLRQRAFPLQAMISRCLAAEKPIVWGV